MFSKYTGRKRKQSLKEDQIQLTKLPQLDLVRSTRGFRKLFLNFISSLFPGNHLTNFEKIYS